MFNKNMMDGEKNIEREEGMGGDGNVAETPPTQPREPNMGGGEKSFGPIVGIIVIVIILVLGGLYFWGQKVSEDVSLEDEITEALKVQSESDEVSDIEVDLGATELDVLIEDLDNIEGELGL